jgi:nicotinate-nucleotide adenylyltransferase
MNIVFGGSFNPPTIAHLEMIKKLLSTFDGSNVLLLPVGDDYKKPELLSFFHRFEMVKILIRGLDHVYTSDIEAVNHYQGTLESLRRLEKTYKNLHFVIGSDHLHELNQWINYKELLKSYPFIVLGRKNSLTKQEAEVLYQDIEHHFIYIDFDQDISSTEVRLNKQKRKTHLTPEINKYIIENHLYEE